MSFNLHQVIELRTIVTNLLTFGNFSLLHRTEKILEVVMQYCAKDKNFFLSQLEGLPFELCEDDQLRAFSCDDPLYLSNFHGKFKILKIMYSGIAEQLFEHDEPI